MNLDTEELLRVAENLADVAREAIMPHFRKAGLGIDNKAAAGAFDPVTAADRAAESAMRSVLARHRPADAILGEEEGTTPGTTGLTWVLDPIDGTRGFMAGTPTWGVLIGLDDGSRSRIGVIDQPHTRERWTGIAGGNATFRQGADAPAKIRTRSCPALGDAVLMTTDEAIFTPEEAEAFRQVRRRARLCRLGCDCYAYALLAMGQIDLVIESGLQSYDVGALIPVIEAAGGVITGWRGEDCRGGGRVVAAGDAARHAEVVDILSKIS